MGNKEFFKEWCAEHPHIPLFLQYDWLNTIAPDNQWDVALVHNQSELQAFMPYFHKRKLQFRIITMPPLTPYLGPYIHFPEGQKAHTRHSFEKKMMKRLMEQLPQTDRFIQYFHPCITNWLPWYWNGFEQTTRYTYLLHANRDPDALYDGLSSNIRRVISKSEKSLEVVEDDGIGTLHALKVKHHLAKNMELNNDEPYLDRIYQKLKETDRCKVWLAKDGSGRAVGAILTVWDHDTSYYLVGATDPEYRNTGASSLLLWTAIKHACSHGRNFNFEGSMVESIERYFRSFGAVQTPYFEIRKTDSRLLKVL